MALIYQNIKLIYYLTFPHRAAVHLIIRISTNHPVQQISIGKFIDKRHDGLPVVNQPLAGIRVLDIILLGLRNMKHNSNLIPVLSKLIQHQKTDCC